MRSFCMMTIGALALVAAGCDKGSTSDPKTLNRNELNPPSGLVSVTDKDGLELRWNAANAEDELQGYDVFVVKATLDAVKTANPTLYPSTVVPKPTLDGGSFPRCKDNTKLFESFGFLASDKDCEGDAEPKKPATGTTMAMLEEGTGAAATPAEKLLNFVPCKDKADATMSLIPTAKPVLTQQTCKVTQYWDPATKALVAMKAGEAYVVFVATIAGADKNTMSWTSNFIEDAPNARLFDDTITFSSAKAWYLPTAKIAAFAGSIVKADWQAFDCDDSVCRVNVANTGNEDGLWLGRRGVGDPSFPQRLFFSTVSGGTIATQLRGPQTQDPAHPTEISYTIPGDEALSGATDYVNEGSHFPVYGNQVFDLKLTTAGAVNYGKIVFYSAEPLPTDPAAAFNVRVVIIMQPLVNSPHYMQ